MYFFCLYLCRTESLVLKTEPHFTFFIWFGVAFCVTVLNMYFWCSYIGYRESNILYLQKVYHLLKTAIKAVLYEISTNLYFQNYVIHYIAKTQYTKIYNIRNRLYTLFLLVHESFKRHNKKKKKKKIRKKLK